MSLFFFVLFSKLHFVLTYNYTMKLVRYVSTDTIKSLRLMYICVNSYLYVRTWVCSNNTCEGSFWSELFRLAGHPLVYCLPLARQVGVPAGAGARFQDLFNYKLWKLGEGLGTSLVEPIGYIASKFSTKINFSPRTNVLLCAKQFFFYIFFFS